MAQKKETSNVAGVVMGIGALAALSAGAYFLYGTKEGAKKRVKVKGWMLKAKGEVMEKMESLKEMNEDAYNEVVNTVMKKYTGLKNVDPKEVDALFADIKKHWKNIQKHVNEAKKVKMPAKKMVKKAAK